MTYGKIQHLKEKAIIKTINKISFGMKTFKTYFCAGEMAERSNAAVLKTVEGHTSGGSNPSLSATCFFKSKQPH
jgi:hypothetical protein